jgi:glycerol uptake facilitator-like aquaporin
MNPARSVPDQIIGQVGALSWISIVGPFVGASLAALSAAFLVGPPDAREIEAAQGE